MAAPGYVLKNKRTTLERAEKFISNTYFTDCNLRGRLYPKRAPLTTLQVYKAPGRIPFSEAVKAKYEDVKPGSSFGPTWSTYWFYVEATVPENWAGEEVVLVWDSDTEGLVWYSGEACQGLTAENKRTLFTLTRKAKKAEKFTLHIEMACNGVFGAGAGSQIAPPDPKRMFSIKKSEIAVIDRRVHRLLMDLEVIIGMAKHLPEKSNRAYQALYTANTIVNTCEHSNPSSYDRAHEIAERFLQERNGASQHTVCAVGHCHIDSAWLWPYAETIRKCARSWSSTVRLMDQYPDFTFACSQAQQFSWVKEHYPALYRRLAEHVTSGRFVPVGGTWVEMDGNLPSGEACCRQFLYGQRFFKKEFGITCKEFWLPDTFGYSGQLPQIMKQSGIKRLLTQKLSWNLVNKFPHHTFWWSGIDGSQVLAHFPPGDSYNMNGHVEELVYTVNNFQDKGRSNYSMYLFGWGDGGQGPTEDMIERLLRLEDVDGIPKVEMTTPDDYFTHVEKEEGHNLCVWHGELFFELHNGTYTSQAKTKQGNRKYEFLLHNIEVASTMAMLQAKKAPATFSYPSSNLDDLWKLLLLNQFHDVLPGSSIGLVYKDVKDHFKKIKNTGGRLMADAVEAWVRDEGTGTEGEVVVNTLSWPRTEVVRSPALGEDGPTAKRARMNNDVDSTDLSSQIDSDGNILRLVSAPACCFSLLESTQAPGQPVKVTKKSDGIVYMENEHLTAAIDECGRVTELLTRGSNRNAIVPGQFGNQFVIFDDVPLYWDAWDVMDYHLETRKEVSEVIQRAMVVDSGPLRATVKVLVKISDHSYIQQFIMLDAGSRHLTCRTEVTWHEAHKFLKVEFPVNVLATEATYEVQMGHLKRPSTFNTSWDAAKFEVCGHKWADVSEYNFGLAVLNDSHYGWSCINNLLRLSLLRSPKSPDEKADMGVHSFTYAIMPHTGTYQEAGVIQAAYSLNCPLLVESVTKKPSIAPPGGFVTVDNPAVIMETMKKSEDHEDTIVLRFYEAFGGGATVTVKLGQVFKSVHICNILEEIEEDESPLAEETDTFQLEFKAFQIISVLVCMST